jgi:hypothetical protein
MATGILGKYGKKEFKGHRKLRIDWEEHVWQLTWKMECFCRNRLSLRKDSFPHLADITQCLRGNKVSEEGKGEEERGGEEILALATNKTLDLPTHSPITLLPKQFWLYLMHKDQSLEQLNS